MNDFFRHQYAKMLFSLGLDNGDYVVAGSGPLLVRGLVSFVSDLDIVVRKDAWESIVKDASPTPAPFGPVNRLGMFDGALEILDGWFPELWTVADLIRSADTFDGVNFINLDVVRRSKEILNRPIDVQHLALIDKYVTQGGT